MTYKQLMATKCVGVIFSCRKWIKLGGFLWSASFDGLLHNVLWGISRDYVVAHNDVMARKRFPHHETFVAWWRHQMEIFSALLTLCVGIHRSPVNSPHVGQSRGALMFSLICAWINGWVNNREAGDLRRYRTHYDVIVMGRNHRPSVDYPYKGQRKVGVFIVAVDWISSWTNIKGYTVVYTWFNVNFYLGRSHLLH